jgi:glycosidase
MEGKEKQMAAKIEDAAPRTLAEASLVPRGSVHPSPVDWRDQILYQLLPDRFSDGREHERELFDFLNPDRFCAEDKAAWMAAGTRFTGGTIRGIQSKLDYLQALGVTTLWINPPWKQRAELETYHGYGIQDFLDIDPRFGTRQELRDLVDAAHKRDMYVILDVIFNHSGNNWFYRDERDGSPKDTMPYRFSPPYPIHGWRSSVGESITEPIAPEDGVWPAEFQNPEFYTRAGSIGHWGVAYWEDPQSPDVEFRRGDFYDLKDMDLENDDAIRALARAYQYWIALTDCDGFRVDAVKHVSVGQSHKFCSAVHEYAQYIGKDNFFLTGEITDGSLAPDYVDFFGRNLDAILGIVAYPNRLAGLVKGLLDPMEFFTLYNANTPGGTARQLGRFIVHVLDDHDMSSRATKARFAAGSDVPNLYQQVAHVVGVQLTTPGIPAIYYGTEQAFDGSEDYHDYTVEGKRFAEDRYVREAMHGANYGAFGTQNCHFFNPDHPTYQRIAAIARLRNRQDKIGIALRRGHLYPRDTSFVDRPFSIPGQGELVAWSRLFFDTTVLVALNTHAFERRGAQVTVDASMHPEGSTLTVLYRGDWSDTELRNPPLDQTVEVTHRRDGRATVPIELPPSGMIILA